MEVRGGLLGQDGVTKIYNQLKYLVVDRVGIVGRGLEAIYCRCQSQRPRGLFLRPLEGNLITPSGISATLDR